MYNKLSKTAKVIQYIFYLTNFSCCRLVMEKFFFALTLALLLLVSPFKTVVAQGQIDSVRLVVFNNYHTFPVQIHTNGYSLGYGFLKYKNYRTRISYHADVFNIIHPKEDRITNRSYSVSKSYVYGKINSFLGIRMGYGLDRRLVEKSEIGSIGISLVSSAGAIVGFQKPIYYQIIYPLTPYSFELHDELFDPETHTPDNIYSKASFFKGIADTKLVPGLFLQSAFSFDYGRSNDFLNRLEVGVMLQAYLKKIEIMAVAPNSQLFGSFFISYRFGITK
ncbi:MAG TPA: hypothetical protein PL017_11785 [Tenuifilaceae bacterium]|nr:hypothetical protein [Tenuifilaceae bacterium]HPJ46773.1 hypothetical protein [Tenuifilaceae bacterium]